MSDVKKWVLALKGFPKESNVVKVDGKEIQYGCHLGFMFLPTRFTYSPIAVKCLNQSVWNNSSIDMFFAIMEVMLCEEGFICVLNSGMFEHALAIRHVAHGKFCHVQKMTVLFADPLHDIMDHIAIRFLVNYCRRGSPSILDSFGGGLSNVMWTEIILFFANVFIFS